MCSLIGWKSEIAPLNCMSFVSFSLLTYVIGIAEPLCAARASSTPTKPSVVPVSTHTLKSIRQRADVITVEQSMLISPPVRKTDCTPGKGCLASLLTMYGSGNGVSAASKASEAAASCTAAPSTCASCSARRQQERCCPADKTGHVSSSPAVSQTSLKQTSQALRRCVVLRITTNAQPLPLLPTVAHV